MRSIAALAATDIRLALRDRSSIFWIFLAPFLWVWFFGSFNQPSTPGSARVGLLVLQQEDTEMADRLVADLRGQNFEVTVVEPGQEPPPEDKIPPRSITIPAGFAAQVAARQKIDLQLRTAPRANAEADFATEVALHRAIIRFLSAESFGAMLPEDDAVKVSSTWATDRPRPEGNYQTVPGNMVMFVLIATMTYGAAFLAQERRNGMLRRQMSSPMSRGAILAGKMAGRAGLASVQVCVFILIALLVFKIDLGTSPAGLAALVGSFVLCAAALSLLCGSLLKTEDAAAGVGITVTLIMSGLGGCWWPSEVMPAWMRATAKLFPTAWAMNGLHQLLSWGGGLRDVLPHIGVLSLMAVSAWWLAARQLRQVA